MKNQAYPAIYDFSLLPYALGDVLTWNVKQCIKAQKEGFKDVDVYLCVDKQAPASIHQQDFINADNYELHLFELLPAFYTNPMLGNVYIYHDRVDFGRALEKLKELSPVHEDVVSKHTADLRSCHTGEGINQILREGVSSHEDLNAHCRGQNSLPKLIAPKGCKQDVQEFKKKVGPDCFIVITHFRLRNRDSVLGTPEKHRDADQNAWFEFIQTVERKFEDVVFILPGKLKEKPVHLLGLRNVIVPRLLGYNLGHELGLFNSADLFLGTSSGFAAMANFTDIPYLITKMSDRACENYGIKPGELRLPFANDRQLLCYEPESVQMLMSHFGQFYRQWKQDKKSAGSNSIYEVQTAEYFKVATQWLRDSMAYSWDKVQLARMLMQEGRYAEALQILDRLSADNEIIADNTPLFQSLRAISLFHLKRYSESRDAAIRQLRNDPYHPLNGQAANFLKMLDLVERQEGATN
jgi:hypothetical protein